MALVGLLLVVAAGHASTQSQTASPITAPEQAFGARVGDDYFLATLSQFEAYWKTLDRESDRMALVDIGRTEEGRSQWMAIVTAPENFKNLDRYKDISRRLARAEGLSDDQARALAAEGKSVVWIDGGLHADEVLGAQQLIETVYQLVSGNDAETLRVLRDVIVLAVHANPDGHSLVANWYMREPNPLKRTTDGLPRLYQKYVGHDNNRDFYMGTQAETINMNRILYQEWFPQIVYDHHQTGPPGTVMYAPPFGGPSNYLFDPLVTSSIELLGGAMQGRLAAEGKDGVTTRTGSNYSTWWNGGLRTTAYFHNQIGLMTETVGDPTPITIPYVAERQRPGPDLLHPVAPQRWHFRQSIDYSVSANRAVLDVASRQRQSLLFNVYRMGKNSIDRASRDSWTALPHRPIGRTPDPTLRDARGYILPSDQPDFLTATKFVNALLQSGVAVHRATEPFAVNGKRYPAGSYVVKAAQAYRPHVLDMFEPQDHPDDIPYPGGPPRQPYDNTGWTLAFQMAVKFDRVLDAFDGPFEKIEDRAKPAPGRVVWLPPSWLPPSGGRQEPAGYLVSHRQNDTFVAVNRLLKAGEDVYWLGTGMMYVGAKATTAPVLQRASADLGLTFTGVAAAPAGQALKLRPVRIGLADVDGGSVPSGWTRWLLERYEFPFTVVDPRKLDAARLAASYDVLILPDDVMAERMPALKPFVEQGGTVVAIGASTSVAILFGLPVSRMPVLPPEKYYIPGSLLRVSVDNTSPLGYGFEQEVDVFFDNSPVFRLDADAASRGVTPVAWFASPTPLRSGWAWGQSYLNGTVAVIDAAMGKGRVLLFGPQVAFRAQSHGTFKFLFNGIYYGSATPVRLTN